MDDGVCFVDDVSAPLRSSDPLRAEVSSHTFLSFSCSREHLLECVCVWGGFTAGCHVDGGNHGYTGVTSNSLCVILPQSQREHETFIQVFRLLIFITHSLSCASLLCVCLTLQTLQFLQLRVHRHHQVQHTHYNHKSIILHKIMAQINIFIYI